MLSSFKSYEIEGGSIGTWMARLWKGEVAAALLPPGPETPWDAAPVVGITTMLQFGFFRPAGDIWQPFTPVAAGRTIHRDHDLLLIGLPDAAVVGVTT